MEAAAYDAPDSDKRASCRASDRLPKLMFIRVSSRFGLSVVLQFAISSMQATVCSPGIAHEGRLFAQRSKSRFAVVANPTHGALPCFSPLAPSEPHQHTTGRQMSFYRALRFAPMPGAWGLVARGVQPCMWHMASCLWPHASLLNLP
jgi:hypothetical protein